MRARFIQEIGTRHHLRILWDEVVVTSVDPCTECKTGHASYDHLNVCPNSMGSGKPGVHEAISLAGTVPELRAYDAFDNREFAPEEWPKACAYCGAAVPVEVPELCAVGERGCWITKCPSTDPLYNTESGHPEPGDVYANRAHAPDEKCSYWDNCDGVHWHGVLPNGVDWCIDSIASNCTRRSDLTHRCWVRSGSAEQGTLTVGKGGHTCDAGAGSIAVDGWHGFLRDFEWRSC